MKNRIKHQFPIFLFGSENPRNDDDRVTEIFCRRKVREIDVPGDLVVVSASAAYLLRTVRIPPPIVSEIPGTARTIDIEAVIDEPAPIDEDLTEYIR